MESPGTARRAVGRWRREDGAARGNARPEPGRIKRGRAGARGAGETKPLPRACGERPPGGEGLWKVPQPQAPRQAAVKAALAGPRRLAQALQAQAQPWARPHFPKRHLSSLTEGTKLPAPAGWPRALAEITVAPPLFSMQEHRVGSQSPVSRDLRSRSSSGPLAPRVNGGRGFRFVTSS